jgi:NAD(P)H-nitrite reductase large subunit
VNEFLIIGSGPAGFAAAETIRTHDPRADIKLLTDDPHGYYSRPGLAYYLTGELPENILFPVDESDFMRLGIRRIFGRALKIDPVQHKVLLADGTTQRYDRALVAVGAQAVPLRAPGIELAGVVKLDSLHDARQILQVARKARTAVVIGGGITALELVEGLAAQRVKVHYFLRGDRYWSGVLDEPESRIVEGRLVDHGVYIHYQTELDAILGVKGRVNAVRTKDGETIRCDLVAYAIGVRPRLELAATSGLKTDRGILVDEHLRTNAEDVFAAGDVAQVYDPLTGETVLDSLWSPARQQGRYAGMNMAGALKPYEKTAAVNVTRLAGLTTTIIGSIGTGHRNNGDKDLDLHGIARGDSETWRDLPDAIAAQSGFEVNRLRIMVGKHAIKGALVIGDQKLSTPLQELVQEQVNISPIRERLLAPQAPLADILVDYYTTWRASGDPIS